jgi:hypothetical protein
VDTLKLIERHIKSARLSPINSGSTIYKPQPRGITTFLGLVDYPYADRKKVRGVANAIAELSVDYAVPDISDFVILVEHRRRTKVLEVLYSRV